ncbi:hypothetical protein O3G_MSEX005017 [Manduca sexta]|uniref:Uncharacterized protein n=2 Tax=Manduca sexta TaxID=7130 RepID=A0A921YXL4_MANSE|nr:hypothetical protein O3G_MSEX005017 [Manduca sexta]
MLPLQPKLLPGYNLQSSYLSNTLSTVRPPDLEKKEDFKPSVEVILEKSEENSVICCDLGQDRCNGRDSHNNLNDNDSCKDEINSNVIEKNTDTISEDSPNNNSY